VAETKFVGTGSGEQPGSRQAMDAVTRDLVRGGVKPAEAERKARELARDWDRKNSR
jgi:hypothetical protein